MATDFRSGRDFPRPGRQLVDGFAWFARVSDKARAARAGTIHDYIYPCPMDVGVFQRWGITADEFDRAISEYDNDDELVAWLKGRVTNEARDTANRWCLEEKTANLDRQDREEGVVPV
jgi:hypothetical protein